MKLWMSSFAAILPVLLAGASLPAFANVVPKNTPVTFRSLSPLSQAPAPTLTTSSSFPLPDVVWPDAAPKIAGAYITMELSISGTPCFDCVNGSTKGTFGSGYPLGYVNTNISALGVLLEWFDISYTGSCTLTVTLTLGGKVLKSASGSANPTPGGVQNALMHVTRSSSWHGAAAMTGKVVCGGTTIVEKGTTYFE